MNDLLKQRLARLLDNLSDERGDQILDYIEFLENNTRSGRGRWDPCEDHRDRRRHDAGRQAPIQAISGTMGLVDAPRR